MKKIPRKLSDIKFSKKGVVTGKKFDKMLADLDMKINEIEEKRKITDYSRLHIPMDI